MFKALILCLLFVVSVDIQGPTEGTTDEPLVLDGSASTGDRFKWLIPDGCQALPTRKTKLVVVPTRPGRYTFTLIAVDKELEIAAGTHVVEVKE